MTNPTPPTPISTPDVDTQTPADAQRAALILRGVQRMLRAQGFESLAEVPLANGRRADILGIGANGEVWIIEIKSSIADFRSDRKWQEYRDFCDGLSFAVAPDFPTEILPGDTGLILADAYGGEIAREAPRQPLAPARRKTLLLSFARLAAMRLHMRLDPGLQFGS